MAKNLSAEQPQLFIQPISLYYNEEGSFTGAFCVVKANFATKKLRQLNFREGCPMWVNPSDVFPFMGDLLNLDVNEETGRPTKPVTFTLDANTWQPSVAMYRDKETEEVAPRVKNKRTEDGELVPDRYEDGTVKVFIRLTGLTTNLPDWA